MYRKIKKEEPPKGAPLWMITYSDMITLVLCFFVLLYSYSSLDVLKWKQVVASVKGSLGVMDGGRTIDEAELIDRGQPFNMGRGSADVDEFEKYLQEMQEMANIKERLLDSLAEFNQRVVVEVEERGVVLRFQDSVLFDKGKAYLKPEAKIVLQNVGEILKSIDKHIRIEGHTDDLPINTPQFPSNWELSTTRATNVLRYLLELGLEPKTLSAVGYGEYHPLVPNENEESRQKNRRVDIVILKDSISLQEPKGGGF